MKPYIAILLGMLLLMPVALAETPGISGVLVSSTTESLDVPDNGNLRILQTKYDPYPAEPGQLVTLWVAVQNWGDDSIDNAYLRVVPEYPFRLPQGNGIEEAGRIAAFGERLVEYDLIVDENAIEGTYAFDVQQCLDATCSKVIRDVEIQISVKTGGSPRIKVGLEDADTFWGGEKGAVTINIVNRGKLDIKFLTLTLLPSEDYEILSPTEIYVGELESDDFETTDFTIFVTEGIGGKDTVYVDLPVKVEYTDSNNHDYSSQAQVKLKIYSQEDLKRFGLMTDSNGSSTYLIVAIVILGAGFWYWKQKKKKH
jgi:LPXTG-motif cell wall-anchored protein